MKFVWEAVSGGVSPVCEAEVEDNDGIRVLSCLLMDDGGIPYIKTISWVEEGIQGADAVLNGNEVSFDWDRESWGALIAVDGVKVYSLHDEDCFQVISLESFRNALVSWKEFLKASPVSGESKPLKIRKTK